MTNNLQLPPLILDGRTFEFTLSLLTAAQDNFVVGHLRAAGVYDIFAQDSRLSLEEKRIELLTRLLISGHATAVLAGMITEAGKNWNQRDADRNAQRFNDITDLAEKDRLREVLGGIVLSFFPLGEKSSPTSPSYSSRSGEDHDTGNEDQPTSATSLQ